MPVVGRALLLVESCQVRLAYPRSASSSQRLVGSSIPGPTGLSCTMQSLVSRAMEPQLSAVGGSMSATVGHGISDLATEPARCEAEHPSPQLQGGSGPRPPSSQRTRHAAGTRSRRAKSSKDFLRPGHEPPIITAHPHPNPPRDSCSSPQEVAQTPWRSSIRGNT